MTSVQIRGLTRRMLILAAVALLPVLLLMVYVGWINTEEKIARERTRTAHLAELLAREQALPFTLGRQLLHSLAATHAVVDAKDAATCHAVLKQAVADNPYLTIINIFSPAGDILNSSSEAPPASVADRDWFRDVMSNGRMVVSNYLIGKTSKKPAVAMALPLRDKSGKTRAVLMLGIDLGWMGRALANVPAAEDTNIVVVDGQGTVLAPERWLGRSIADHPVFKHVHGITAPKSFEEVGIDGVERIFVARPLNQDLGGRSYLWVAAPKSSASEAVLRDFLGGTLLVFCTVLALFAVIWWEGGRMVLRPVRELREVAERLGRAQLSARTDLPHGNDEIGRLAASFDEMAERIETREHDLERSRESLLRANRALRMLTTVKDAIVHAEDEQTLFDDLCLVIARQSGSVVAFVARADEGIDRPLTVVAQQGMPANWRESIALSWGDNEHGRCAAGVAVREGHTCVIHDVRQGAHYGACHALAKAVGFETVIGLPVRVGGRVWGALVLACDEFGVFDQEEASLLEELAGDVGRGIETLRLRVEKQAAEEALLRMMDNLERRVDERTRDLEAANRDLQSFSYSVSHDLRAPLRSIEGFAHALDEECGPVLSEDCRGYLERIRDAAQRMGGLIEDMIRLAQISSLEMRTSTVDLTALAAKIGAELAAAEPQRQMRLTVAPGLAARGDPGLLRVLMQNLLTNAWKYSSRSPQAEIEFGLMQLPSNERAYFVRDNGAGFDMAFADRLFRPFSRLHHADDFPGTGIGLATVARIIARHGGRVWAAAEKGKGATFYFVLD
ncbi:MAG: bacteriophytochrome (light-regulated signal transduction histidine kinase) [Rhodocyclaceae bacterium]|nr:MAG: bacteriophytochrome (light-regulated signal transduction histidine kinase) [Rhodocyclaceae bacterium]TND00606.1 MAG: bacteriophytochrome (light-regulated signal transduction histidine kinase) [Rhodocyclaceae bacterium]